MKHVFSMETEREKDLQTLADTLAFCMYKKDRGICRDSKCENCATRSELESCMEQLPACDSLRVKQLGFQSYSALAFTYGAKRSARDVAAGAAKTVLQLIGQTVGILLLVVLATAFMALPIWALLML